VIAEEGSELASELWATPHPGISSILSYPEARAALAAARRGARLSASAHTRALEDFESLHGELSLVAGEAITLVSWDEDLRRAAARNGCALAPPTQTPAAQ
jgi:hypothetical protein